MIAFRAAAGGIDWLDEMAALYPKINRSDVIRCALATVHGGKGAHQEFLSRLKGMSEYKTS